MVCVVRKDQAKEGTHAFKEECYHIQSRGSSVGVAVASGFTACEGSWTCVHCGRGLEHTAARLGAHDLCVRGLSRLGQCSLSASGVRRAGGRPAANPASPGKAFELGFDWFVAAPFATTFVAGGHRLAPGAVLRRSAQEPQRTLLRQTPARHREISCLCHGLYRALWAALHVG